MVQKMMTKPIILLALMAGLIAIKAFEMDVVEEDVLHETSLRAPDEEADDEILRSDSHSCFTGGKACGDGFKCTCKCTKIRSMVKEELGYQSEGLALHNKYRSSHEAPDLKLKEELNAVAMTCASFYVNGGNPHDCPQAQEYGENIAGSGSSSEAPSHRDACISGINRWYKEKENYDWDNPGVAPADKKKKIGHFTQLVWMKSKYLGLGCASNPATKWTRCVAIYEPSGNVRGQYAENVRP